MRRFMFGAKATTESQHRVDIRLLKKWGYLWPGVTGSLSWSCGGEETGSIGYRMEAEQMILNYRHRPHDGEWEDVKQEISFDLDALQLWKQAAMVSLPGVSSTCSCCVWR